MGVGYLTQGSNIGDSKKFVQLCTVLMDKVEQRHGSKLKPIVSFSKYFPSSYSVDHGIRYSLLNNELGIIQNN